VTEDRDNFGYSDYTVYKQMHLQAILQTHLRVCEAVFRKNDWPHKIYHYFDLHAGPGLYRHNGRIIKGSPMLFLDAWMAVGLNCRAVFFEIEDDRRTALIKNLSVILRRTPLNISVAFHGDHLKFLPCYFDQDAQRPRKKFGLIYADPSGSLPPFELLARFFEGKGYSTLDVLLYCSPTNLKRQLKASTCPVQKRLGDYLELIPKRHWIVREPYGPHQWTFLIGTNWTDFPTFERLGFYRWDSARGKEIFDQLNFTREELAA